MTDEEPVRCEYRFDKFRRALARLEYTTGLLRQSELDELRREGLVQRFEYTFESAWKTLADYLSSQGVVVTIGGARNVIRAAYEAGVISDGDAWIEALKARNESAHVDDEERIDAIIEAVEARHYAILVALRDRPEQEADGGTSA